MTTIYLIRTGDEFEELLLRNPNLKWGGVHSVAIRKFLIHHKLPIALFIRENNHLSWSSIDDANNRLERFPDKFILGTISPVLPYGKVFTTFLKHHNAYDKFITQDFFCTNDIPSTRLLLGTFDWEESSEGFFYWYQLDDKWRALINTLKLNRNEVILNLLDILH